MENGRIVGIGGANVDFHAQSHAPLILRDSNPGFARITAGGVTRNILENLARMGDRVSLISAVGDDLFGSFILSESREAGIDMDAVLRCPGHSSSCYAAIMDERGDMFLGMSDMRILEQLTDEIILERMSRFNDVDCVVTDPNLPESTLDWLLGGALGDMPLFVDPVSTTYARKLRGRVGHLYCLKPNLLELGAVVGREIGGKTDMERAVEELLSQGCHSVAVSLGRDGCYYADRDGVRLYRSLPPVEFMVDATGAGDAFMAGMVHGYHRRRDAEGCLELGLAAGRICVSSEGTVSRNMSDKALKEQWEVLYESIS